MWRVARSNRLRRNVPLSPGDLLFVNQLDLVLDQHDGSLRSPSSLVLLYLTFWGGSHLRRSQTKEDHKLPKPNYQFEKRRRDIQKKAKKEEKKLRKLQASDPSPPNAETK